VSVALTATSAREVQLGVGATFPMNGQHHLGSCIIHVHDDFADEGADDALA